MLRLQSCVTLLATFKEEDVGVVTYTWSNQQRKEDYELEASLRHIMRCCLKIKKKKIVVGETSSGGGHLSAVCNDLESPVPTFDTPPPAPHARMCTHARTLA